jgi:hypothetical protein
MKNIGKLFFVMLAGLVLLTPLVGWGQEKPSGLPSALTIGTSSVGSTFYIMTVGMANLITKKTGINITRLKQQIFSPKGRMEYLATRRHKRQQRRHVLRLAGHKQPHSARLLR